MVLWKTTIDGGVSDDAFALWLKDLQPFAGSYIRIKDDVVYGIDNAFQTYETEALDMEPDILRLVQTRLPGGGKS